MRSLLAILLLAGSLSAADFTAGVARLKITPEFPIWMSGYASRTHASEGVVADLWAKALALEDQKGRRVVIITTDLIGLPRSISDLAAARAQKQWNLERSQLLFNSSHTHTGPVVRWNLSMMFDLNPEDTQRVEAYGAKLTDNLVTIIGAALGDLAPADVFYGHGEAGFAMNRREPTEKGVKIGVNPQGPVDHDVPVLKVVAPDGRLRAVLFGYACHNTTLGGNFYKITGDYAGFAEAGLENAHPGTTAMFMELCGADQNPNPRGTLELAQEHGKTLATEVDRVLSGTLERVRAPVRSAFQVVELGFAPRTREDYEPLLKDKNPIKVRYAKTMLRALEERQPIPRIQYPVQAVRFNKDLTIVALGGEVVVDYDLRIKREFRGEPIVVAGYSNDVMCYIPSVRVLKEGGYEPVDSMIYYGQPGPLNEDVEGTIMQGVRSVLKRVGR
jgi:neutral ceramidase